MTLETLYLVIALAVFGGLAGFTAINAQGLLRFLASWTLILAVVAVGAVVAAAVLGVDLPGGAA